MLAVFGFAGLSLLSDGIAFNPQLPAEWLSLAFGIEWRGSSLKTRIGQEMQCIEATLAEGEPMMLTITGERRELTRGGALSVCLDMPILAA